MFILSKKACFLTRTSPNTFSGCILHKPKRLQNFQFLTKTMDWPLCKNANFVGFWNLCKNANFVGFWNRRFFCSERLVCYIKRKNRFFKVYFHDLWHENTGGLKGLQGVTRGYKRLQGVTGGYKGLQEVTRGYKGLQGVTGGYRGLKGVTRGDRRWQGVTGGCKGL